MGFTDEYIILYSDSHECWTALSTQVGLQGRGESPEKALDEGIKAMDKFIELTREIRCSGAIKPISDMILELAKIAEPLNEKNCIPGVIYKHERFIKDFELSMPAA